MTNKAARSYGVITNDHLLKGLLVVLLIALSVDISVGAEESVPLPNGFVYIDDVIPDIKLDLRYYTAHNFIGERIDGYVKPRGIVTSKAADALAKVQQELRPFGLSLKIFDAYRPQRAVDHFVRWAEDLTDTRMKAEYYPNTDKENLFRDEYIAARSSHTRGSTVDLTIVSMGKVTNESSLDMGSGYDFFGPESWPSYAHITAVQRANRLLLRSLMINNGFKPYPKEWWHFTLEDEPYPDTWFNFPVQ